MGRERDWSLAYILSMTVKSELYRTVIGSSPPPKVGSEAKARPGSIATGLIEPAR